ncbi:glycosyltransferase [Kordiimonas aquimaris]|uniref:glycosyltransferase n=1 Tax=Kordiimonas aquimaris TaxID=707591 RepID=UPI0021D29F74|nr:glycosyltransferase [Kordiimonas aquimaris]
MHVLVTSPIPSHPQNHGNRARVFSVCKALQARGYIVHFVYGGLEGLSGEQETAMRRTWDHTYVLPGGHELKKKSHKKYHLIDDWYNSELTALTQRIMRIWDIKACFANYVWFSRWLEDVPAGIPKIIDTHDIFADRDTRLKNDGIDASWFSTIASEEAKALCRADTVLAIQDIEAAHFVALGHTDTRVLGHLTEPNFETKSTIKKRPARKADEKMNVGYLASDNPINQHSLKLLAEEVIKNPALSEACNFHIAGALSRTRTAEHSFFNNHGFVDDAQAFHHDMDLIINPNIGGTGLKIKSIDALSYGVPLLATKDAMVGIETDHPFHQCKTVTDLCEALLQLKYSDDSRNDLALSGQNTFTRYQTAQQTTLNSLFPAIEEQPR